MLDGLRQLAGRPGRVVRLRLEAGDPVGERLEPPIEPGEAARLVGRGREAVAGAPLVARERLVERRAAAGNRLAVLRRVQLGPDLRRLARPQPRGRDLGRLVFRDLEPAGQLARIELELRERRPVRPPAVDRPGHRRPQRLVPAERVEQVALPALVEESLLLVLAVDLDEGAGHVGEARRGHRLVVEAGRRPAGRGHVA